MYQARSAKQILLVGRRRPGQEGDVRPAVHQVLQGLIGASGKGPDVQPGVVAAVMVHQDIHQTRGEVPARQDQGRFALLLALE